MRSWARALRPCCVMARSSRRSQSGLSSQWADRAARHLGVAVEAWLGAGEALQPSFSGTENAGANLGRAFGR